MFAVEERNRRETRSSIALWRKCRRPSWLTQPTLLHYYCISFITAITCFFSTSGLESQFPKSFPHGLTESHFSQIYLFCYTHRCFTVSLNPPNLNSPLSLVRCVKCFSHLWRKVTWLAFEKTSLQFNVVELLQGIICWTKNVLLQIFKQSFTLG